MLNARLYRTCWIVAGVALVVALLTLQPLESGPENRLPAAVDGTATRLLAAQLQGVAPSRPPGTSADERAADWVRERLAEVPGGRGRVGEQEFVATVDGVRVPMRNVYLAAPGTGDARGRGGVLVVAPRDTPTGVRGGASGTALMIRLATVAATTAHDRPYLFVSTDGSTAGNAGVTWFLSRFSAFPIEAAIVLDAPGEALGDRVHVWSRGRGDRQALGLAAFAAEAIERAGGRPRATPALGPQLVGLAVPQTFGEQGALIAAGVPAVTLSGRPEAPLGDEPDPDPERLELVGDAAWDLLGSLDAAERAPAPSASVALVGKVMRPTVTRMALLLLALPLIVMAVDAVAGLRRARVPLAPGVRAVLLRCLPLAVALAAAHLLVLLGALPGTAAGAPPLPGVVGFDALAGLALAIAVGAGALAAWRARRRIRAVAPSPAAEGAAALGLLALVAVAAALVSPFALVLILPAAHAALLATGTRRPWQLVALGLVAVAPLVATCVTVSGRLDRDPAFAAWYLAETAASGARGITGIALGLLAVGAVWSLAALAALRARKDLAAVPAAAGRPRARW